MDFTAARRTMVESQIRPNQVTDAAVLAALAEVPREAFVPKGLAGVAYVDEAICLEEGGLEGGRHLMEPLIAARLLQAATVTPTDVALEVGCGPGYGAAVLAHMASTVVALESDPALAAAAADALARLEINTVTVVEGPLSEGWSEQAPYDVIIMGGAVAQVPAAITDQLAEGGRLAAVLTPPGQATDMGRGTLFVRQAGVLSHVDLFDAGTPPLPGFAPPPAFVF